MSDACPACGEREIRERWPAAERLSQADSVAWCSACGFGWQDPLPTPEAIRAYYAQFPAYNLHGASEKQSLFELRVQRLSRLRPAGGRLLDVGSGLGHFLQVARAGGWGVAGIEPQESAAQFCADELGIEVHDSLTAAALELASFDVVTLWDVWEHVHDPLGFLDQCLALLRPDGLLVFAVPNASGLPARLFKGDWRYVMNTHLSYLTRGYVRRVLAERDCRIVREDHTVKAQSVLQGMAARLSLKLDVERVFRAGRGTHTESGRPESERAKADERAHPWKRAALGSLRRLVLRANRQRLPLPVGDLMDVYAQRR